MTAAPVLPTWGGVTPERVSLAWLLAAFVLTTAITRALTRYIRHRGDRLGPDERIGGPIRDVLIAGVHVHHQVWGILLMILVGFLQVAYRPTGAWAHAAAAAFGTGAALTMDQFALWLHLEDVYWSPRGRTSVTAVITTAVIGLALLLGLDPLGLMVGSTAPWLPRWLVAVVLGVNVLSAVVCLLKGKPWLTLVGIFVPGLSLFGALRLARPRSWWARRFHEPGGRRDVRARERAERHARRWNSVVDLLGGPPSR